MKNIYSRMEVAYMKIIFIITCLLLPSFSFAQEQNLDESLEPIEESSINLSCSDFEYSFGATCIEPGPLVQISEVINSLFGSSVQLSSINNSVNVYTGVSGLTAEDIRQRIGSTTLPDGSRLIDIITVIEGPVPFPYFPRNLNGVINVPHI